MQFFRKRAKKGKKNVKKGKKKGKIFENLGKNVQNLKIFEEGEVIVCDYHMH